MSARARQLLVAFLVCWMPFCCCQLRAAAAIVAQAAHAADADHRPACCRDRDGAASHERDGDCCDDRGSDDHDAPKGNCCTSCKERSLPPSLDGASIPAPAVDAIATGLLADGWVACVSVQPVARANDTGPPPPAGRTALALHSLLLI